VGLEYWNSKRGDVPWAQSEDNPLSPSFKPPRERSAVSAAKWWAFHHQDQRKRQVAESSYEKVVDVDD